MYVDLFRLEHTDHGIIGVLRVNKQVACYTLELPYIENKANISSIPQGFYNCGLTMSPKYGLTYEVLDVRNRSNILFHAGNTINDSRGCILLGNKVGELSGKRAVLNSRIAYKAFMDTLDMSMFFSLKIRHI